MLCDSMKWNHLPMAGGIYDQNPDLMDRFYYIFAERNKAEAERLEKERKKSAAGNRKIAGGRRH